MNQENLNFQRYLIKQENAIGNLEGPVIKQAVK
ncbi:UNVERIFIED_ORG: hypothetical protein QFZ59_003621 [Bacillus sp. B2I3]|nr:hypothetical protein [Bacillus sp. B2I3]